mgnify:CR=1 FL=1
MAFSIDCGGIKDERLLYRTVSEETGGHEGYCNKGGAGCGDDRFCLDRVSVSIRYILPVLAVILDVLMFRRLNVEYEYLFVNGDLDIDKIMNKAKRKRMFSANVNDLEILAPADSIEVRQYQKAKTYNYSSGSGQAALYALVVSERGEQKKIIFEPNDTIVEGFYMMAPRKVVRK